MASVSDVSGSPEPSSSKQPPKGEQEPKRSREGCLICRSRKKKCDGERPLCGACGRLGLECVFPAQVYDPKLGRMVTVRQPNRRKRTTGPPADQTDGGPSSSSKPHKKHKNSHNTPISTTPASPPRPSPHPPSAARAASGAGSKGKQKEGGQLNGHRDGSPDPGRPSRGRDHQPSYAENDEDDNDIESSSSQGSESDTDGGPGQVKRAHPPTNGHSLNVPPAGSYHANNFQPSSNSAQPLPSYNNNGQTSHTPRLPSTGFAQPPILFSPNQLPLPTSASHPTLLSRHGDPTQSTSPLVDFHPHPQPNQGPPPLPSSHGPSFSPNMSYKAMIELMLQSSGMGPEQVHAFQQQHFQQQQHQQQQHQPFNSHPHSSSGPVSAPSPTFSAWMGEMGDFATHHTNNDTSASISSPNALSSIGVPFSPSNWLVPSPPPTGGPFGHGSMAIDGSGANGGPSSSTGFTYDHYPAHTHRYAPQQPNATASSSRQPTAHPDPSDPFDPDEITHQQPFDPTYPHLIPILSPNQPPHLPHQLPSPFLATHQSLPWSPDASATGLPHPPPSQDRDNNDNNINSSSTGGQGSGPTTKHALVDGSDSFYSALPSPFLSASLRTMPDDFDGEVDDFVHGKQRAHGRLGSHSSGSGSSEGGISSARTGGMSPRREPRAEGSTSGTTELDRRRTGKREMLTIAPSVTFNLPDMPEFIVRQAPILFDYFVAKLAPLVSILAPDPGALSSLRNFRGSFPAGLERAGTDIVTVFLPMAFDSDLVLVSILAWSAMHLSDSGHPWAEIADAATSDASERVQQSLREWETTKRNGQPSPPGKDEELLAGLALLSEIEICRGSTQNWYTPLKLAQRIIRGMGGPAKLQNLTGNVLWVLKNITYHELLSSTTSIDGPALEPEEYGAILAGGINSFMGCCQPIFCIIAEISRLSVESGRCITFADRDARIESLRILAAKESRIKARLDQCYPSFSFSPETSSASSYHFVTFRAWVLTARLYLRQVVSHCNAHSLVSQLLMSQLLESVSLVIGTPAESSLLFPIFIAGVDATMQHDRETVKGFFNTIDTNCRIGNIQTAFALLEQVWSSNQAGEKWVNWALISKQRGWNVSFA